jgi:ribonuclease P/MRP protein subunit POP7
MSAVKRVRKQLDRSLIDRSSATRLVAFPERLAKISESQGSSGPGSEVLVLGTGRAIGKVLSVASWFEEQSDCVVDVRTRTVSTVDDVIVDGEEDEDEKRIRRVSALEVAIRLR